MYAVMNEDEYSLSNLIKLQAPLNALIDVEDQDVKGRWKTLSSDGVITCTAFQSGHSEL